MAYIRYKTVKGRRYGYLQESYRVPGRKTPKVRILKYLGAIGSSVAELLTPPSREEAAALAAERAQRDIEREQREQFGETAQERSERVYQAELDKLHDLYGLRMGDSNPTPVEAPSAAPSSDVGDAAGEAKDSPPGTRDS